MGRPQQIDNLEDVKMWVAEHDGRIDAYWEAQHSWNEKVDGKFVFVENRLSALEKKIMWLTGASAAVGAGIGSMIIKAFM